MHYGAKLTFENVDNITDSWKAALLVKPWLEEGQEYLLFAGQTPCGKSGCATDAGRVRLQGIRELYRASGSLHNLHIAASRQLVTEVYPKADYATGATAL